MQKCVTALCALLLMALMSGCGGGSSSSTSTEAVVTTYELPTNAPPADILIGGSVQGPALALSNTVTTFAGTSGVAGSVNTAEALPTSPVSFNRPYGITTDGSFLYIADSVNNMIRKVDLASPYAVTTLAGSGIAGSLDSTDGTGKTATFYYPTAITVYGNYLYVADTGNNMIRRVEKNTGVVDQKVGSTTGVAGSVDSAVAADARFNKPTGITTDGTNLYVTDFNNHTIRRIDIANQAVTTLAGSPGSAGSSNGVQGAALFNGPANIATNGKSLYVTDYNNMTIREIVISSGTVSTLAGIAGTYGTNDTAPGVTATFYHPKGITTDGTYLYVTDYNDSSLPNPQYWNVIRRIEISTKTVATIAGGISSALPSSFDAVGTNARFDSPLGITTDGISLYVADSRNSTIRRIQ